MNCTKQRAPHRLIFGTKRLVCYFNFESQSRDSLSNPLPERKKRHKIERQHNIVNIDIYLSIYCIGIFYKKFCFKSIF